MNVNTPLFEKTLKQLMTDKTIDEKQANELKKFYNRYLDNRIEIKKSTHSREDDVFDDIIGTDNICQDEIIKNYNFCAKMIYI